MVKFQLNKLVRDSLVQKSEDLGITVDYIQLSGEEAIFALLQKIKEEVNELDKEREPENIIGELVDIQQAINDLLKLLKISKTEFEKLVETKKQDKGGFEHLLYVKTMEMDETNPRSNYYKREPERFPEISE